MCVCEVYASMCGSVHMNAGGHGGQKEALDPLELELGITCQALQE